MTVKKLLCNRSVMIWKYEFLVARTARADELVLDHGEFRAKDLDEARSIAVSAAANIRPDSLVPPNVFRLVDPLGEEVWRTNIADGSTSAS